MLNPKAWINLEKVTVLVADSNPTSTQILRQILSGFGIRHPIVCTSAAEAMAVADENEINLIVANDELEDGTGYDFVRLLRRSKNELNAYAPVIMVSGHTKRRNVVTARDCGANFLVAKPLSPQVLLERVVWVSKEARPFVDTGAYLGPDRRFGKKADPAKRRRRSDAEPVDESAPPHQKGAA